MVVIVKMDAQGRILIPAHIRRKIKSTTFLLKIVEGEIRLKPVKSLKLSELFDSIEVDVEDFTDTHELRKSLLK